MDPTKNNGTSSENEQFQEQSTTSSVVLTVVLNGTICIVLLLLFIIFLRRYIPLFRPIKKLFTPMRELAPTSSDNSNDNNNNMEEDDEDKEDYYSPPSLIWWRRLLQEVFSRYPPQYRRINRIHGPRVTTHLFFQHQLLLALSICLVFTMIVILPIHLTGTPPPTDDSWLARTAVVMVAENPGRLVAHVLASFFIVSVFIVTLYRFHTSPAVAYPILCSQGAPRLCDRSVCVTHLPRSATEATLGDLFQRWYPGEVASVTIPPRNTSAFLDAEEQRDKAEAKLRELGIHDAGHERDRTAGYNIVHDEQAEIVAEENDNDTDNNNNNNHLTQRLDDGSSQERKRIWIRQGWRARRVGAVEHWQRKKREAEELLDKLRREYAEEEEGEEDNNNNEEDAVEDGKGAEGQGGKGGKAVSFGRRGYVTFWRVETAERCVEEHGITLLRETTSLMRTAKNRSKDILTTDVIRRGGKRETDDGGTSNDTVDQMDVNPIEEEEEEEKEKEGNNNNNNNNNSNDSIRVTESQQNNDDNVNNRHTRNNPRTDTHPSTKSSSAAIKVRRAPQPWEIAWRNADTHVVNRSARKAIVHSAIAVFLIFFTTPTSLVSGVRVLLNTGPVAETVTFVRNTSASFGGDVLLDFIFQYLPTLLLVVFASLIPILIKQLTLQEKYKQHSKAERVIFSRLYVYLVLSLLVLPSLLLSSMDVVIGWLVNGDFGSILERLFPPESGAFFLNILLQYTLLTVTLSLIRIVPLVLFVIKWFRAKNEKDRENAYRVIEYDFSYEAAAMITVVGIAITYSITAPLTLVAGVLYLGYRHLVDRYILLHVCHKHPEKPHERVPHATAYNRWLELMVRFMFVNLIIFVVGLLLYFSTSIAGRALYVPHFVLELLLLAALVTVTVLWQLYTRRRYPVVGGIGDNGWRKRHIRRWKETKCDGSHDNESYWPFGVDAVVQRRN